MSETDKAYKLLFGYKEMVASLLQDFVREAAAADLDLDTLEPWPSVHVSGSLRERIDDRIWRFRWKDDDWCYVFVILEFQSTPDRWMASRILYFDIKASSCCVNQAKRIVKDHARTLPGHIPRCIVCVCADHQRGGTLCDMRTSTFYFHAKDVLRQAAAGQDDD